MKLYYSPGACSLVVRIILNELGVGFQDEEVDLRNKKTASGANFWEVNPKGAVPALVMDDGGVLTENQVILQYLCDSTAGQTMLPSVGNLTRYRTLEWLNYISTELHKTVGMFFNPNVSEEMKAKILIPIAMARFKFVNEQLSKGPYIMGQQFGLPDVYLFVVTRWTYYFKLDLSEFTHLQAFMDRMSARPAVIESLKQEKK